MFSVRTPITVRYGETDMMGVVYHANYVIYFEDGRTQFVEEACMSYAAIEEAGYMCPIRSVDVQYHAALRYGEAAFLVTKLVKVSHTLVTYAHEVYREGMIPGKDKPLVSGRTTCCVVEKDTFKPVSFKRALPELFARYQEVVVPEE